MFKLLKLKALGFLFTKWWFLARNIDLKLSDAEGNLLFIPPPSALCSVGVAGID